MLFSNNWLGIRLVQKELWFQMLKLQNHNSFCTNLIGETMAEGQLVVVGTCLLLQDALQTDWGQLGAGDDNRT